MFAYCVAFALALAATGCATPFVRRLAVRLGAVDQPGGRRVHSLPTPRLGGLAIFVGLVLPFVVIGWPEWLGSGVWRGHSAQLLALMCAATVVVFAGSIDDCRSLSPGVKVLVEIVVAGLLVAAGYRMELSIFGDVWWLALPVTVLWLAGVMNAVNMIDGLDGLAAGVCLTISVGLFWQSVYYENRGQAFLLAAVSGSLVGFLPFNFRQARIFLGDSGSLLLGLLVGVGAMQGRHNEFVARSAAGPVLALGVPLAELGLTSFRRILRELRVVSVKHGQARYSLLVSARPRLFSADKDHIHHRLLRLGLGPQRAVIVLCLTSAIMVVGGLFAMRGSAVTYGVPALLVAVAAGVRYLGYCELQPLRSGLLLPVADRLATGPTGVLVLLDLLFCSGSLMVAVLLCARSVDGSGTWLLPRAFPLVVLAQVGGLVLGGLYQKSYRALDVDGVLSILRCIALAIAAGFIMRLVSWSDGDASILVVDSYLVATCVMGSRLSCAFLDHLFEEGQSARRVLIYGADQCSTEMADRLSADGNLQRVAVGFVDDDPRKRGSLLHGLRVYALDEVESLARHGAVDELLVGAMPTDQGVLASSVLRRLAASGVTVVTASATGPDGTLGQHIVRGREPDVKREQA